MPILAQMVGGYHTLNSSEALSQLGSLVLVNTGLVSQKYIRKFLLHILNVNLEYFSEYLRLIS